MFAEAAVVGAAEVALPVVAVGGLSAAAYRAYRMKRARMGDYVMEDGSASAFQPEQGRNYGTKLTQTACRAVQGRYKKQNIRRLVEDLLVKESFRYQSLQGSDATSAVGSTGYYGRGSIPLWNAYSTGSPGVSPQVVALPIYVFRLNAPNGYQSTYPNTGATPDVVSPVIGFSLYAEKLSGNTYTFKWKSFLPNQNMNPQNRYGPIFQDTDSALGDNKIRYDGSRIEILYTAPTQFPSTLTCGVVHFNRDVYAPPDEYYDQSLTLQSIRPNSGAWDIAVPVAPDEPDRLEATAFWQHFMTVHDGHPLRRDYTMNIPKLFTWEKRFVKEFTPKDTTNEYALGYQHKHTHTVKSGVMYNTTIFPKEGVTNTNPLALDLATQVPANFKEDRTVGVFPHPQSQKWFMVHAFSRQGPQVSGTTFDPTKHASFDISITSAFAATETIFGS